MKDDEMVFTALLDIAWTLLHLLKHGFEIYLQVVDWMIYWTMGNHYFYIYTIYLCVVSIYFTLSGLANKYKHYILLTIILYDLAKW